MYRSPRFRLQRRSRQIHRGRVPADLHRVGPVQRQLDVSAQRGGSGRARVVQQRPHQAFRPGSGCGKRHRADHGGQTAAAVPGQVQRGVGGVFQRRVADGGHVALNRRGQGDLRGRLRRGQTVSGLTGAQPRHQRRQQQRQRAFLPFHGSPLSFLYFVGEGLFPTPLDQMIEYRYEWDGSTREGHI